MSISKTNLVDGSPQTITIASGQTASSAIFVGDSQLGGYKLPAAFTGTTITVHGSMDGGATYEAIRTVAGAAIAAVTVSTGQQFPLPVEAFNYSHIKLVSGSAEGADRSILVFLKG